MAAMRCDAMRDKVHQGQDLPKLQQNAACKRNNVQYIGDTYILEEGNVVAIFEGIKANFAIDLMETRR